MIMIRQYYKDKWEQWWKEKFAIKGYLDIQILSLESLSCSF